MQGRITENKLQSSSKPLAGADFSFGRHEGNFPGFAKAPLHFYKNNQESNIEIKL
jgi:hypothetical protein